jgi:transposase-like protein
MDLKSLLQSKPAQRSALADWYRSVLELAAEEGVSIAEVAQQAGCSGAVLYAWRRKLRLEVAPEMKKAITPQPSGLLRLKVASTDRSLPEGRFEVRCRGGRTVLVPGDYDSEALRGLIEVVESC